MRRELLRRIVVCQGGHGHDDEATGAKKVGAVDQLLAQVCTATSTGDKHDHKRECEGQRSADKVVTKAMYADLGIKIMILYECYVQIQVGEINSLTDQDLKGLV